MKFEADGGYASIRAAQSAFVMAPILDDREKRTRQFQGALHALKLQPFVHKSQLNEHVSAGISPDPKFRSKTIGVADSEIRETNRTKPSIVSEEASVKIEWPQLILLAKAEWEW